MKNFLSEQHLKIIERVLSDTFPTLIIQVAGKYDPLSYCYIIYINVKDISATLCNPYFTIPIFVEESTEFNKVKLNKIIDEAKNTIEKIGGRI